MTSERPPEDKAWNYVRPLPKVAPFVKMDLLEDGSYECVVLDGLPAKVSSNSDDPPNSFHTRDTFLKHPSIPNAWKYLGRLDDRITLVNGEKVLPVPIEHRIRQNRYVQDNLVYGVGRPLPGLLVVPSVECQKMTKAEILEQIWPDIAAANANAEAFSQISRDMVIVLDPGCSYPATDKGTMIRNRCYLEFNDQIEEKYRKLQEGGSTAAASRRVFDNVQELEQFLLSLFRDELGFTEIDLDTDFYEAGVDSLQAIKARGVIQNQVDIGSAQLGHNVIYDCANIRKLAAHLDAVRTGQESSAEDELSVMARLIDKYSTFVSRPAAEETVVSFSPSLDHVGISIRY